MSNKDSRFVSCGDTSEKDTVRENFLKKNLASRIQMLILMPLLMPFVQK